MLRLLSNVTYPGHARLATDRRLLEGDNWNCGCDGANRDEHLTLEPRDPPLGTRQNYTKVSDQFWRLLPLAKASPGLVDRFAFGAVGAVTAEPL